MQLITNPDTDFYSKWISFTDNYNTYNIFQTPQMFEVYKRTPNYTPFILADIDKDGNIRSTFLFYLYKKDKDLVSLFLRKGTTVGLPVAINREAQQTMLQYISSQFRKPYHIIKVALDLGAEQADLVPSSVGFQHEEHLNYIIDLTPTEEELWKNISETRRKQIKRASKRGLEVQIMDRIENVDEIYAILKETYIRNSLKIEPIDLFINANAILPSHHSIKYFMAYADEKLVAFRIQLLYKKYVYDWYAGNLTESQAYYPNDLLVWEVLKWGNSNGYTQFNFGGAGKPNKPYGVREFKKRFGGKLVEYGYWVDTDSLFKPIYQFIKK